MRRGRELRDEGCLVCYIHACVGWSALFLDGRKEGRRENRQKNRRGRLVCGVPLAHVWSSPLHPPAKYIAPSQVVAQRPKRRVWPLHPPPTHSPTFRHSPQSHRASGAHKRSAYIKGMDAPWSRHANVPFHPSTVCVHKAVCEGRPKRREARDGDPSKREAEENKAKQGVSRTMSETEN